MAVACSIKFTQSSSSAGTGIAMFGTTGSPVTVQNGLTTPAIVRNQFILVDAPPTSSLFALKGTVVQDGAAPTYTFTPDVQYGYEIQQNCFDALGNEASDSRVFGIQDSNGLFVPPYTGDNLSLNFVISSAVNVRGWAPFMEQWLAFVTGLLTNPTVLGTVTWKPVSSSPIAACPTLSVPYQVQTTSGAHTAVLLATVPLPGTAGAPITKGGLDFEYDVGVFGTTTAVAARWKGYASYAVQTSGSPVISGVITQTLAYGTNSGSVPAGWTLTLALDGTSKNILLTLTTDASDTYDASAITQQHYTK